MHQRKIRYGDGTTKYKLNVKYFRGPIVCIPLGIWMLWLWRTG